jgi:glycosyltransferase involved in cell wall biosynthesis
MEEGLVSVIIIFLDPGRFLVDAIESVVSQTYTKWELILVDDGSSDGSSEVAEGCAQARPGQVIYCDHAGHKNLGMSASRNLGLQKARGEYVAFLDADDLWLPDKLHFQVSRMEQNPDVDVIYCSGLIWNSWDTSGKPQQNDLPWNLGYTRETVVEPPDLLALWLGDDSTTPSPSMILARRTSLLGVGGSVDSFRNLYEDQVLCAKLAVRYRILVSPACLIKYRQHEKSCCAVWALHPGRQVARRDFLLWTREYLVQQGVHHPVIGRVLDEQLRKVRIEIERLLDEELRRVTADAGLRGTMRRAVWAVLPRRMRRQILSWMSAGPVANRLLGTPG